MKKYKLTNWNNFSDNLGRLVIKHSICVAESDEDLKEIERLNKMGDFRFEEIKAVVEREPDVEERGRNAGEDNPVDTTTKKPSGSGVRRRGRPKVKRQDA